MNSGRERRLGVKKEVLKMEQLDQKSLSLGVMCHFISRFLSCEDHNILIFSAQLFSSPGNPFPSINLGSGPH